VCRAAAIAGINPLAPLSRQVWKERLWPLLREHCSECMGGVAPYLLLYHEASLVSLLELVLFHADACLSLGEEHALELADWCMRHVGRLCQPTQPPTLNNQPGGRRVRRRCCCAGGRLPARGTGGSQAAGVTPQSACWSSRRWRSWPSTSRMSTWPSASPR
jgi:hypothetical protein